MSHALAPLVGRSAVPPFVALRLAQALLRPPGPDAAIQVERHGDRLEITTILGIASLWLAAPGLGIRQVDVTDGVATVELGAHGSLRRIAVLARPDRPASTIGVIDRA